MDREALIKNIDWALPGGHESPDYRRTIAEDVIAAIESAGLKIMGREPTEEMCLTFRRGECVRISGASGQTFENYDRHSFYHGYIAMFDAAPTYTDKEVQKCQK